MTIKDAFLLAKVFHRNQKYGEKPYIYHLLQVYKIALKEKASETVLKACLLHDIVEDTKISVQFLSDSVGKEVVDIVLSVTNEPGKNRKEKAIVTLQKTALNRDGVFVKLCDRLANGQHSKIYNNSLWMMYKKEYNFFKSMLYKEKEYDSLWERLDICFEQD
jgi:(p)ppGpp synthase/HD superfamily hydrolase